MEITFIAQNILLKGKKIEIKEEKARVYINDNPNFFKYLQFKEDGTIKIMIFLKNKKFEEPYQKSEWRECFLERDRTVQELNTLEIGIKFNNDGIAQDVQSIDNLDEIFKSN